MTDHERLMLRRHLERAARSYEERVVDVVATCANDGPTQVVAARFREAAQEARDFANRIMTKTLL